MQADNKLTKKEISATEQGKVNKIKDVDISEKYRFTLLREEAVDKDSFEDGTHEKIATTLYKLIKKEKGGVTVGLEGVWGSGKSAIVSILGSKLKSEKKIHSFTFDAWAHEGDPLRRIFLESLIESFPDKNEKLEELQLRIAKRLKTTETNTTRSVTGLGKLLAIATIFFSIGLTLLTKVNFENFTLGLREKVYLLFLVSIFLVSLPFCVLSINLFYLLNKKKKKDIEKVFISKNWAFMKGESTEKTTQEVSEDDERSSIEFENYFKQIMAMSLEDDSEKRLVMVIDNLDRIDSEDSLKIWSTLQTFLQQRNMPVNNNESWFEKIWIIVPYDPDGLAKIWDKNEEYKERKKEDVENEGGRSQIFFDKCFQLKFEVPKPILTTWHSFARQKISEALGGWDTNEQEDVLNILKLTRKDLNDIPTPRQIKNYINQVGLMRMHSNHEIPTALIAYYVVLRVLQQQSVHSIREKLINGELPESNINLFLSETSSQDMAGLTFGVSPNKGQQLLLEPEIEKALQLGDGENLRELQEKQLDGFWGVFNFHIQNRSLELKNLLPYSKATYEGLWEKFKSKLNNFSKKAQYMVYNHEEFDWPDENTIYYYSCLSAILSSPSFGKHLYKVLVTSLDSQIDSDDKFEMNIALNILQQLIKIFNINKQSILPSLVYNKFVPWAQASAKSGIPAWKWIVPDQSLATEISDNIKQGATIFTV